MTDKQETLAPEQIWISWPKNPADDRWYYLQPDIDSAILYARVGSDVQQEETPERLWINPIAGMVAHHKAGSAFHLYARVHRADDDDARDVQAAIADMEEGRTSHQQWLDHLSNPEREDCKGCTDHVAHIGDLKHHQQWIEKYDRVIRLLSLLPQLSSSERRCGECGHGCGGDEQGCEAVVKENPLTFCGCKCVFPATGAGEGEQRGSDVG